MMENEGNSLLELPLESSEILEEVNLTTNAVDVTDSGVENVGEMLIDESAGRNIPCMESNSIDFEFSNSDLGHSTDFNIDHPSVFGIADNVIGVRDNCDDIFRDSTCFTESNTCKQNDAGTSLQNSVVPVPGFSRTNPYKDLGLKLQVIPLNNLQYVSTIQTSRGLHILAIPAQTSVTVDYNAVNVQHMGQKAKPCQGLDINQSLGSFVDHKIVVNRMQSKIEEMPALQIDMVKKANSNNKILGKQETVKTPSGLKCRKLGKVPSKSSRKLRNTLNRKVDACRKNSFRRCYVQKLFSDKGLLKKKKNKTLYIDVVKSPNISKGRMVSLLKASVTNKLKQTNNIGIKNAGHASKKEIKLTFHLKPNVIGKKSVDNIHAKQPVELVNEHSPSKNGLNDVQRSIDCKSRSIRKSKKCTKGKSEKSLISGKNKHSKVSDACHASEDNIITSCDVPEEKDVSISVATLSDADRKTESSYKCKICLATFHRKGNFNNHIKTHSEMTRAFNVNIEEKNDEQDIDQGERRLVMQGKEVEKDENVPFVEKNNETDKLLKCEFCALEFKSKGNLIRHKLTHSLDSKNEVHGRYHCDDCNKPFLQKCDLKRHVATHSGIYPYVCSVCKKGFIRRSDLSVHGKFHTQEKKYKCQICSKAYYQTGDLSRHVRQNHSDLCAFACEDCGKKYTTQKTLNLHTRAKH